MKKTSGILFLIISTIFFLISCTSTDTVPDSADKEQSQIKSVEDKSEYLTITTPYTLESLLLPVLQINNFMMSMDYFDQFRDDNDYLFPDYLFTLLAMETDTYKPGELTVLSGDSVSGLPAFKFEKAFLSKTEDGTTWWRYFMISGKTNLSIEVLVNPFGVPLKIRFEPFESGEKFEIVPDLALDFERAKTEVPADQLSASVADKVNRSIEEGLAMRFVNPVIMGEEIVNTPAGEFMSVLVKDFQTESTVTNYWLSPDVPGGIIRISVTNSSGQESHIIELMKISGNAKSNF